jgi:hypothetical protein
VDHLAGGDLALDGAEKAGEFAVAMALPWTRTAGRAFGKPPNLLMPKLG